MVLEMVFRMELMVRMVLDPILLSGVNDVKWPSNQSSSLVSQDGPVNQVRNNLPSKHTLHPMSAGFCRFEHVYKK